MKIANRPLYAELAAEFVRDIRTGRYPLGALLPTEIELASERHISRSTARAALNHLVSLGLVTRQKGVGTRVERVQPGSGYNPSTTTIEELVHFNAATKRTVHRMEKIVADDKLAARLDGRLGKRWIKVATTRQAPNSDQPISWTDNFIDEQFEGIAEKIPTYSGLIVDLIGETYGVAVDEVRQIIRAIEIPKEAAAALLADNGTPALEITRRYKLVNTVRVISISIHPSDRFEYSMTLRRPLPS